MKSVLLTASLFASLALALPIVDDDVSLDLDIDVMILDPIAPLEARQLRARTTTTTKTSSTKTTTTTTTTTTTSRRSSSSTTLSTAVSAAPVTTASSATSSATTTVSVRPSATSSNPRATGVNSDGSPSYYDPILVEHNAHRANHSAPNIAWDTALTNTAQKIASSCVYAHDTSTDGGGYGQNIGAGYYPFQVPAMITNGMYNGEVNFYPGYVGEPSMANFTKWGHFSQIVWKNTLRVGCYTQYCPNGLQNANYPGIQPYFTVCNYGPPGKHLATSNVLLPVLIDIHR